MTTQNALNTPAVSAMGEIASSVRLPWVVSRNTPPSASTIEPILRQARGVRWPEMQTMISTMAGKRSCMIVATPMVEY